MPEKSIENGIKHKDSQLNNSVQRNKSENFQSEQLERNSPTNPINPMNNKHFQQLEQKPTTIKKPREEQDRQEFQLVLKKNGKFQKVQYSMKSCNTWSVKVQKQQDRKNYHQDYWPSGQGGDRKDKVKSSYKLGQQQIQEQPFLRQQNRKLKIKLEKEESQKKNLQKIISAQRLKAQQIKNMINRINLIDLQMQDQNSPLGLSLSVIKSIEQNKDKSQQLYRFGLKQIQRQIQNVNDSNHFTILELLEELNFNTRQQLNDDKYVDSYMKQISLLEAERKLHIQKDKIIQRIRIQQQRIKRFLKKEQQRFGRNKIDEQQKRNPRGR